MELVRANCQGELSPLERGLHALWYAEKAQGKAGRGLSSYAQAVASTLPDVSKYRSAAGVFELVASSQEVDPAPLLDKASHLYEISKADQRLWPVLVKCLIIKGWSVKDTKHYVERSGEFVSDVDEDDEEEATRERALAMVRAECGEEIGDAHARPGNRNAAKGEDKNAGCNATRVSEGVKRGTADHWRARLARDAKDIIAEIKVRAERRMGEELSVIPGKGTHGGDRSSSTMRLDDLGISKTESSRWQAVAAIPDDEFEDYVASQKNAISPAHIPVIEPTALETPATAPSPSAAPRPPPA